MNVTFLNTSRDNPLLVYQGYSYIQDGSYKNKTYWKCEHSRDPNNKCHARIHTDLITNKVIFVSSHKHHHSSNEMKLEIRQVYNDVKQQAIGNNQEIDDLISNSIAKMSIEARKRLPKVKNIKRLVDYHRTKKLRKNSKQIDISCSLTKTLKQEKFLYYDSGIESENRVIILTMKDKLTLLTDSLDFHIDSNELNISNLFSIFHVFYVNYQGKFIPVLFALLENKSCYDLLFKQILLLIPNWNPLLFLSDYDIMLIDSVKRLFSGIRVTGSYYHYRKYVLEKLNIDSEYAINRFVSLAFVSVKQVDESFKQLKNELEYDEFINSFQQTFIDQLAPFPIEFWNIHDTRVDSLKMAKDIEYWHSYFQNGLDVNTSLNLHKFLRKLEILEYIQTETRLNTTAPASDLNEIVHNVQLLEEK
ncbi:unnamed protein product [Didymodactylos carnosus]|uniref:FLYWCH-type domain-containing protein n=1 Tax=Didymodactylos carnosus TaxID=1234261 RepID=A0A814F5P3_9BILA|nr:unnamed protein product [Didymodactylos carnosus]CAF3751219.1 unnamed protein product [Didymodactylos carnosus]